MATNKIKYLTRIRNGEQEKLLEIEGTIVKIGNMEFLHYKNENGLNFIIDMDAGLSLNNGNKTKKEAMEVATNNFPRYLRKVQTKEYQTLVDDYKKLCKK